MKHIFKLLCLLFALVTGFVCIIDLQWDFQTFGNNPSSKNGNNNTFGAGDIPPSSGNIIVSGHPSEMEYGQTK